MASFCQMILIESASDSSGFVVYMLDFFVSMSEAKKQILPLSLLISYLCYNSPYS